ncbi:MAG: hypothetical protein JKX81_04090 [Arenicella sp.]|nr:hypothetical protein [Arenicella sp.]
MIRLILVLLLFSFIGSSYATTVQVLDNCNASLAHSPLYTILSSGRNTLNGWSHIVKAKPNGEFASLTLDDSDYLISRDNYLSDESCGGEKVQSVVLVMKLSDWTRQHSSGIEAVFDNRDITFGAISHVLMDIRVNSTDTDILNQHALNDRYKSYLTPEQFQQFDQGKVNLGINLYQQGDLDPSTEALNLELFVEIDQALYIDQWVRVLMPLSEFHADTDKAPRGDIRERRDFHQIKVNGLRINPENSQGKQLRNLLGSDWSAEIPETFKQMSISLRRIELLSIK